MTRSSDWRAIAVLALALAIAPAAGMGAPAATGGPKEGGACKVTGGANAGKTGTYDTSSDPGHTWCSGPGFSTECGGYPDNCTSALVRRGASALRNPVTAGAKAP